MSMGWQKNYLKLLIALMVLTAPGEAFAQEAAKLDTGDTAWIIVARPDMGSRT